MAISKKYKLYPSSAAFAWGDLVFTEYDSGCLRSIFIKSRGIRTDIHPLYAEVGELNEERHEKDLAQDERVIGFAREVSFKTPINDRVDVSGRRDFDVTYEKVGKVPHECKAIVSASGYQSVIKDGKPKASYVAQLVTYMIDLKVDRGKIVTGYYEKDVNDNWVFTDSRDFKIEIDENGNILYDRKFFGFTVHDRLTHRFLAAEHVGEGKVGPRPNDWDSTFKSPCKFCAFKNTCDQWDTGEIETVNEYLESAKGDAEAKELSEPKIKRRKK